MACNNNSAVIDVLVENKEIPSFIRDSKNFDRSNASSLDSSFRPSLDSFNTIQDTITELKIDDDCDLSVSVDNPQKVCDTLETYVAFRVTTKTARVEFEENEYIVRRRYNDFVWLRQKLTEAHPFCIIPPLPAKHTLVGQLDRYSRDFVLLRMKALNVFIKRVAQHPILSCNEYFKTFITAKQGLFDLHRKQKTTAQRKLSTISHNKIEKHAEFDQIKNYLTLLQSSLGRIERITSKIHKEKTNAASGLGSLHPVFATWAMAEPDFSSALRHIGKAVQVSANAENNLTVSCSVGVSQPIKELLSYVDAVQEALKKRETCQKTYEYAVGELNRRQSEKDRLSGATVSTFSFWKPVTNDDRLLKVDSYISQLLKHVETNQDNLECANECLRSDLKSWQREKDAILRKILQDFVNKQLEYHTVCANAWEQAMHEFSASSRK